MSVTIGAADRCTTIAVVFWLRFLGVYTRSVMVWSVFSVLRNLHPGFSGDWSSLLSNPIGIHFSACLQQFLFHIFNVLKLAYFWSGWFHLYKHAWVHMHTHTYIHNFASFFSLPMALPCSITCFLDDRHCLDKDRLSQCSFNLYFLYGEERGTLSPYVFIGQFYFFFWEPFVQLIFFLIV